MKIKLSKSRWENMGKEAGWMKISTLQTKNQTQQNELLSAVDRMVARLNDLKGYISSGQVSFNNILLIFQQNKSIILLENIFIFGIIEMVRLHPRT